ncbi:hypothetical protein EUX98_g7734, partial [Antrodiella citrinella]
VMPSEVTRQPIGLIEYPFEATEGNAEDETAEVDEETSGSDADELQVSSLEEHDDKASIRSCHCRYVKLIVDTECIKIFRAIRAWIAEREARHKCTSELAPEIKVASQDALVAFAPARSSINVELIPYEPYEPYELLQALTISIENLTHSPVLETGPLLRRRRDVVKRICLSSTIYVYPSSQVFPARRFSLHFAQ